LSPVTWGKKKDDESAADLSRLVVIGDSINAGVQNFSLYDSDTAPAPGAPPGGQKHGYIALVANQAGVSLDVPLISYPGLPPVLTLAASGQIVPAPGFPGHREQPAQQAHNLSVPGFTLADVFAHPFPGDPHTSLIDAYSFDVLALPGNAVPGCGPIPIDPNSLAAGLKVSVVACAIALKPTTILVGIGNNDALQALTFGLPPTDPSTFAAGYSKLLQQLAGTGATIVVSNIPDVTSIPFLASVPAFKAKCPIPSPPLPSTVTNSDFVVPNLTNPTSFNICTNYAIRSAALIGQTHTAVEAYNLTIAAEASVVGAPVVDVNSLLARIHRHGFEVGGLRLTSAFLGGIFSLDGLHPTNTGYAILANEMIKTMNEELDTTIAPISVEQVSESDPLVFGKR